jgi:hypothetical protein
MKRATELIAAFARKSGKLPLGRWSRERNAEKLDHKIDLANEDHCGPCGQYALTKAPTMLIGQQVSLKAPSG